MLLFDALASPPSELVNVDPSRLVSARERRIDLLFWYLLTGALSFEDVEESPISVVEKAPPAHERGVLAEPKSRVSSPSSSDWTGVWKLSSFAPQLLAVDKLPEDPPKKPFRRMRVEVLPSPSSTSEGTAPPTPLTLPSTCK